MGMTGFLLCWPKKEDYITNIRIIGLKIKRWRHFQHCTESKKPVWRTPLKTCYSLNARGGLAIPDSNKISEAPRNAIYLYWQDKESSRRDQRWQPILRNFTILFQGSALKIQKTGFQCWLLNLLVLPLKPKSILKRFHQGNSAATAAQEFWDFSISAHRKSMFSLALELILLLFFLK